GSRGVVGLVARAGTATVGERLREQRRVRGAVGDVRRPCDAVEQVFVENVAARRATGGGGRVRRALEQTQARGRRVGEERLAVQSRLLQIRQKVPEWTSQRRGRPLRGPEIEGRRGGAVGGFALVGRPGRVAEGG